MLPAIIRGLSLLAATSLTTVRAASSSTTSEPSQPTLLPAVHWDIDTGNLETLAPTNNQNLYYSAGGISDYTIEHVFASVSTNTSYPSVVLEHSSYIISVIRKPASLEITFAESAARAYAEVTWSSVEPLVLVTFTAGRVGSVQQRTFYLVDHVKSQESGNVINAAIRQVLEYDVAMPEVEISWGTYRPSAESASSRSTRNKRGKPGSGNSGPSNPGHGSPMPRFSRRGVPATLRYYGAGNSTSNFTSIPLTNSTNSSSCGPPPSRMIDGFYTATCGSPSFDQDIDAEIGYFNFNGTANFETSLKDFAPGLVDDGDDYEPTDNTDFGPSRRRRRTSLRRRAFFSSVSQVFKKAGNFLAKAGQDLVQGGIMVAHAISTALAITKQASADIPINVGPSKLVDSPWGRALQMYNKQKESKNGKVQGSVALYCVDCGVQGTVHLNGQVRWTIADGLTQANAGLNGNIAAALKLGVDASVAFDDKLTYPILSVPVPPGFSIPKLFTVGPQVTLDAEVALGITLAGQVLAGVNMSIPNFSATLDLVDGSKSVSSGFTPTYNKVFEAKAAISARAAFGLPLGIGLGIDIPPINFRKSAALYDKPYIEATMNYSGSTTSEGIDSNNNCLNGIAYAINFANDIYADLYGLKTFDLYKFTVPITSSCI